MLALALPKTGLLGTDARLQLADIGIPAVGYECLAIDYVPPFGGGSPVEIERR